MDVGAGGSGFLGCSSSCGHIILRLLGINVLEHGHDCIQVVMAIQGALKLCGHGGFEQIQNCIISMSQLLSSLSYISDVLLNVISRWII